MAISPFFLWNCDSACFTLSLAAGIQWITGKEGKKRREEKGTAFVFSSSASSFLSYAALEIKEQKTLFVFLPSTLFLPCDFPRPQFPLLL